MSVNSLHEKKKPSEMMGEYVAGKNRVNVLPTQRDRWNTRSRAQSIVQSREAEYQRQQTQHQGARSRAQSIVQSRSPALATGAATGAKIGGTVLTQEQVLANNINDIIKRMNDIMSQPGNLMSPSSSPYYNIYMEQYRKNAEAAEANAFARSVASSGGYGSSYATMAGQQAYRDTMAGFAELTPTLTQTKGQAMSDLMEQYQLAKGLKDELNAEQGEINDMTYAAYASIAESGAFNTSNEAVIRARLENMKAANPDLDVDKVMEMLRKEQAATGAVTVGENGETLLNEANVDAGYQYIATVMQEATGSKLENMKNTLRTALKNGVGGVKLTDAEIDAAMEKYSKIEDAGVRDVQEANRVMYEKALKNPSEFDLTTIGYNAEETAEMTDAEKKQAILDAAGEAVKRGEIAKTYYSTWMLQDAKQAMLNVKGEKPSEVAETLAGLAISFEDGVTAGYMSQQVADRYLKQIAEMAKDTELYGYMSHEVHAGYVPTSTSEGRYNIIKTGIKKETGMKNEKLDALAKLMTKYWEDDLFK